jgi:hypothetical protein
MVGRTGLRRPGSAEVASRPNFGHGIGPHAVVKVTSVASATDATVEQLTGDVHVPHVARRLLDEVEHGPTERGGA